MAVEFRSPLATQERRLCEIDQELAVLRREQRLFRRIGFTESFKVMQIVALQMEQQECLAALPSDHERGRRRLPAAPAQAAVRRAVGSASLGLGLLLVVTRELLVLAARRWLSRPSLRRAAGCASLFPGAVSAFAARPRFGRRFGARTALLELASRPPRQSGRAIRVARSNRPIEGRVAASALSARPDR